LEDIVLAANNISTRVRAVDQNRRVMLGGILGLLILLQAGGGLFALWYSHASAAQSRAHLGMIADALDTVRSAQASFGVQIQEWKNILLRDRDPVLSRHHRASFQAAGTEVQTALGRAAQERGLATQGIPAIRDAHTALLELYQQALRAADLATFEGQGRTDASLRGADRALQVQLDDLAHFLAQAYDRETEQETAAADSRYGELHLFLIICAGLGLFATGVLLVIELRRP
jgi:hypothetical protein